MRNFFLIGLMMVILPACEHLGSSFVEPTIDVVKIELLPLVGFEQSIRVDFRLTNHNSYALPLKNISYKLALDNYDLLQGSTAELTTIDANDSEVFSVDARVNLLRGALWLKSLMEGNAKAVNYRVEARLNTGLFMARTIKLQEQGSIPLSQ